jgi:hypothetical protein
MFFPFRRSVAGRLAQSSGRKNHPACRGRRVPFRPRLEVFEDRTLPSTVTWTNPAGGAWEAAGNWSTGALPGPSDDVVIDNLNPGATVTHASDTTAIHGLNVFTDQGTLAVTGGSLALATGSSVNDTFALSGGTITGFGDLDLAGPFNWTGGTMSGAGNVNANGGLTVNGAVTLDGRTLNNAGDATWAGAGAFNVNGGAVVNNQADATFTVQSDQSFFWHTGGSPTFNNAGTFTKAAGTGTTTMSGQFNNSGTVTVNSGTLSLTGGVTGSGAFAVAAGATLDFSAAYDNLTADSAVSGAGTVSFTSSTADVRGTYDVTGATAVRGSSFVNLLGIVTAVGGTLTIDSGNLNLEGNAASVTTFNLSGGRLFGTAELAVTGALNWTGGTMAGAGSTSVGPAATFTVNGEVYLDGRTLNNAGAATWAGTTGIFYAYDGAVVNNQAGATFTVQTDRAFRPYTGGPAVFNNAGAFTKAGGAGTTTVQGLFHNSGTVDVQAGTLALAEGGGSAGGTFTAEAGATLHFAGGYFGIDAASAVGGAGTVDFSLGNVAFSPVVVDLAGAYDVSGSTAVNNATANLAGTITAVGDSLTLGGGNLNFFDSAVSVATFAMSGGMLLGTGDVAVTGALTWTGGYMADVGSTSVAAGATLTVDSSGDVYLFGRTLNNAGDATWAGAGTFYALTGAVINNTGTFTARSDRALFWYAGPTPAFNNAGTFTEAAGTGSAIYIPFNNSGTVNVTSGTLSLAGGGTDSGTFAVAAGATLNFFFDFFGGYHNLTADSVVSGAGSVTVTGGTVDVGGTYDVTGGTTVGSSGTANFLNDASTGALSNSGTLTIASGVTLTVSGNYTQATSSSTTYLYGGTLAATNVNLNGGIFYGLGTVDLGGGTFTNASLLILGLGGSTGVLTINGNYTQTAAGRLWVKIGGDTAGTQYDQLAVSGTATLNGSLSVTDVNGFNPTSGSTFQVLTCGSRSGTFSSTNIDGHFHSPPTYNATDVTVVAN